MIKKRTLPSIPYDLPVVPGKSPFTSEELKRLAKMVKYEGDPRHKKGRGDFVLQAGIKPNPKKTLCDVSGIDKEHQALSLLRKGLELGIVSPPDPRCYSPELSAEAALRWPKCVWAVKGDVVLEARHTVNGIYHGYPELESQALREIVISCWNNGQSI
jgi:hypothetical protein